LQQFKPYETITELDVKQKNRKNKEKYRDEKLTSIQSYIPDESGPLQAHWIQSDNPGPDGSLAVSSSLNIACNLLERNNLPPFVAEKHRSNLYLLLQV
jgi:hypothetical protein